MGSPWTDESAILRDLSFAQGRWVPGGIDSAVAGAQPPAHNITEETEEEYFRHWSSLEPGGNGDFSAGPDLFEIKTMLELMQDDDTPNEEILSGPIEIRKLNHQASHFIPKTKNKKENIKPTNKPRRARNVAIASIMALALSQEPLKLAKPEDFIKPSKEDEETKGRRKDSVNKVTNWLQSQDTRPMFKKKSSVNSTKEDQRCSMKDDKQSPVHSDREDSVKSPSGQYTPSGWAREYYERAVTRSRVRELVREDVWGRAERAMKDIDAQKEELRKQQAATELAAQIAKQCEALESMKASDVDLTQTGNMDTPSKETDENEAEGAGVGVGKILLRAHRHVLFPAAPCAVCAACALPSLPSLPPRPSLPSLPTPPPPPPHEADHARPQDGSLPSSDSTFLI